MPQNVRSILFCSLSIVLLLISTASYLHVVGATPSDTITYTNVPYCNIDGNQQYLDVYIPKSQATRDRGFSLPAVIYVHGGGWINGSKADDWFNIFPLLLNAGFVVVSVSYQLWTLGLAPTFPENEQDVSCAVRFIRANAAEYNVDPSRIGLLGDSAGGQLVSLEALSAEAGTFDHVGQYQDVSSGVQAVVDEFGPTNLTDSSFASNENILCYTQYCINLVHVIFGDDKSLLSEASPVNYVSSPRDAPPFLIQQGVDDTTVYPIQSQMLANALYSARDSVQLIPVQCAGHEFAVDYSAGCTHITPSLPDLLDQIIDFFSSQLG
jgi:acetyl esterase/lipase